MDLNEGLDLIEEVGGEATASLGSAPEYLDFPPEEYSLRAERLRTLMEWQGIDVLILAQEESIRYVSGYNSVIWIAAKWLPSVVVLPKDASQAVLINSVFDAGCAVGTSWVPEIDGYGDVSELPQKVVDHVARLTDTDAVVGMEIGPGSLVALPWRVGSDVMEALGRSVVDATELLQISRMLKSPRELERIRTSTLAAVAGYQAAREVAVAGATEKEVVAAMASAMYSNGLTAGTRPLFLNAVAGPERYALVDTPASDRRLRSGDVLFLDGGGGSDGYMSDLIRMVLVEPNDEQRRYGEAAAKATDEMVARAAPGMRASELFEVGFNSFAESGIESSAGGLFGHGIGMEVWEHPFIKRQESPDQDVRLRPGITLCLEPMNVPTTEEGMLKGIFVIEQMVAITKEGKELLSEGLDPDAWVSR